MADSDKPRKATVTVDDQHRGRDVLGRGEPAGDDLELTAEDPERGHGRQGQHGHQQQRPAPRQQVEAAVDRGDVLGLVLADQHARAHEGVALRGGVRQHVQQHAGERDRRAEAHPDRQDPHVLHAGVGQQPFDIALVEQVQRRQQQRGDAEREQDTLREGGPSAATLTW